MVLHQAFHTPPHALRKLGLALLYVAAMVGGTAALMAALSPDDAQLTGADGQPVTRAEVVMHSAAERALVSPAAAVLAGNGSNERRGI